MYEYAYDDQDNKVPINHEAVELFEKIIKKSIQIYDPEKYPNPALQVKLQSIETLALNLDVRDPPEDLTLPAEDLLQERIGDLTKQINEIFMKEKEEYQPPKKKHKNSENSANTSFPNIQDEDVLKLIKENQLDSRNVSDLRKWLRHAKLSTAGRKSDLVARLTSHYT